MARFAAGVKTSAGTVQWPLMSLFSSATENVSVREIGVSNTTTTAFDIKLVRFSASGPGTVGSGLTENCLTNPSYTSTAMAFTTYTAGTPGLTDIGHRASVGAAIGAGVIWTFGDAGLFIPAVAGTTTGIGIAVDTGAGQIVNAYMVWDS